MYGEAQLHTKKVALSRQVALKHNDFALPFTHWPDLMETFILKPCQIPRNFSSSHYYVIRRKGAIASVVGCGIFNRVLKASSTQMTNVGRLHKSRVISVQGNVFLPLELANDFQGLELCPVQSS